MVSKLKFQYILCPNTCAISLSVTISHHSEKFTIPNELGFNTDKSLSAKHIIPVKVFSSCYIYCHFGEMCNTHVYHYSILWNTFIALKMTCSLRVPLLLPSPCNPWCFVLHLHIYLSTMTLDLVRASLLMAQQKPQVYHQTQPFICTDKQLWLEEVQFLICIKVLCLDWYKGSLSVAWWRVLIAAIYLLSI